MRYPRVHWIMGVKCGSTPSSGPTQPLGRFRDVVRAVALVWLLSLLLLS